MGSKYGTNHLNDPWNSTTHNRVPQSRGVHWLTQWWKPWRFPSLCPQGGHKSQHNSNTRLYDTSTHSFLKNNNFAQPHAQRCVLQMHAHRLVELYQGGILEHGEGGRVEDLLSGRARKAPIYLHGIWGIKTHFTEQMEEGQPDRHFIPLWHPAESSHS